ncbi:winged helix DNA-binding domain-containing protein [Cellulomonas pakistanensis]|uniref:winged helix DNA-binding domain-containing protein n=1 Tax=Cellulomonas pakistanensis TaxID=992287 RepID=UPI001EF1ACD9|nr:winged helix DNA-binding domain-containing protein [Cellulomonas pakistanensis]
MTGDGDHAGGGTITTRGLGRALLARQHLLDRADAPALDVVRHLVALQSQNPSSAYLALHARVAGMTHDDLARPMLDRRATRLALLRDTVHLVTAQDALALWPLMAPTLRRHLTTNQSAAPTLRQVDLDDLRAASLDALADGPLTSRALGERLAATWPGLDPAALAQGARGLLPLVQVTPRGVWGRSLATTWTTAWAWLGVEPPAPPPRGAAAAPAPADGDDPARDAGLADLVRRYLAVYGPATVADVQQWSGLTRLGRVVDRLRPELVELRHVDPPSGRPRVLLDLPGAQRPPEDAPAPPRLLPDFENLLLGHDDRTRVVPADVRPALASRNGMPPGTVLVDGTVAGTWVLRRERLPRAPGAPRTRRERAVLTVTPLRRWTGADRAAVLAEAEAVARFAADDAAEHAVAVAEP